MKQIERCVLVEKLLGRGVDGTKVERRQDDVGGVIRDCRSRTTTDDDQALQMIMIRIDNIYLSIKVENKPPKFDNFKFERKN